MVKNTTAKSATKSATATKKATTKKVATKKTATKAKATKKATEKTAVAKKTTTKKVATKKTTTTKAKATKKTTKPVAKKSTTTKKVATAKPVAKKKVVRKKKPAFTKAIFDLARINSSAELEKTLLSGYNTALRGDVTKLNKILTDIFVQFNDQKGFSEYIGTGLLVVYPTSYNSTSSVCISKDGCSKDCNWVRNYVDYKKKYGKSHSQYGYRIVANIFGNGKTHEYDLRDGLINFAKSAFSELDYKRKNADPNYRIRHRKELGLDVVPSSYKDWCVNHLADCVKNVLGCESYSSISLKHDDRVRLYTGTLDGVSYDFKKKQLFVDIYVQNDDTDTEDWIAWSEVCRYGDTYYYNKGSYSDYHHDGSFRASIDEHEKARFYQAMYNRCKELFEDGTIR